MKLSANIGVKNEKNNKHIKKGKCTDAGRITVGRNLM